MGEQKTGGMNGFTAGYLCMGAGFLAVYVAFNYFPERNLGAETSRVTWAALTLYTVAQFCILLGREYQLRRKGVRPPSEAWDTVYCFLGFLAPFLAIRFLVGSWAAIAAAAAMLAGFFFAMYILVWSPRHGQGLSWNAWSGKHGEAGAESRYSAADIQGRVSRLVEAMAEEDNPQGEWKTTIKELRAIAGTPQGLPVNVTNEIIESAEERLKSMRIL